MINAEFLKGQDEITVRGLTQWDSGQVLHIKIPGIYDVDGKLHAVKVHFAQDSMAKETLVVKPQGTVMSAQPLEGMDVNIPNILLQKATTAIAWVYITTLNHPVWQPSVQNETIKTIHLPITPRPKPADYAYTETEVYTVKKAVAEVLPDELNERIWQTEGNNKSALMSQDAITRALEQIRQGQASSIVQEPGGSTTAVMSQDATTRALMLKTEFIDVPELPTGDIDFAAIYRVTSGGPDCYTLDESGNVCKNMIYGVPGQILYCNSLPATGVPIVSGSGTDLLTTLYFCKSDFGLYGYDDASGWVNIAELGIPIQLISSIDEVVDPETLYIMSRKPTTEDKLYMFSIPEERFVEIVTEQRTVGLEYGKGTVDGIAGSWVRSIGTATDTDIIIENEYEGLPVKAVDVGAFAGSNITSVKLPDSVTRIQNNVFKDCVNLREFTIPSSVTQIDNNAFDGCTNLQKVRIPKSVTTIFGMAFGNCPNLTIYCEAESQPEGFYANWSGSAKVIWGCAMDIDGVNENIGNISTALDSIIEIQNSLIGE